MSSRHSDDPTVRVAGAGAARLAASVEAPILVAGPTGHPDVEPLVVAATADGARLVPDATPESLAIVVGAVQEGRLPESGDLLAGPVWTATREDPRTLPVPDAGPLSVGTRRATARCGWAPPDDLESYREWGVVGDAPGDEILSRVADAGLLGRGRTDDAADEPLADRWRVARDAATGGTDADHGATDAVEAPVVVVNANEADDAVAGDRLLLESDPFAVLDGALAAARAVGAADLVVYVGESATTAAERAAAAGDALTADLPDAPDVQVAAGPETFAAGEATMAIESLQGKGRLEARRRPPGPATWGLYGRPTLVHSARTFAQVRATLAAESAAVTGSDAPVATETETESDGESRPTRIGTDADPGTRLVTLSGDVDAPATVELPTDAPLADALGAVEAPEPARGYRVGGRFGGLVSSLSVPAGANALDGADLGTAGGVEVLGRDRCVLATVGEAAAFAEEGNCGRCVPCREGSQQLTGLLRDVYAGDYDAAGIRELARVMRSTSLCAFGVEAARPVLTALSAFENEVAAHADGRCPAGACEVGR